MQKVIDQSTHSEISLFEETQRTTLHTTHNTHTPSGIVVYLMFTHCLD